MALAAALQLLALMTLDGREVHVNPKHIVTVTDAREDSDPSKRLTSKAHCVITLSDGKFITVAEDCDDVRKRLQELGR